MTRFATQDIFAELVKVGLAKRVEAPLVFRKLSCSYFSTGTTEAHIHRQQGRRLTELAMAATIGEQLRLAREERGIPLREISDQTRISVHYLEAIETNDYRRLPGGIFNRSFVKAYARYVGYDEKEAVEAYTRYMRDQGESGDDVPSTPHHSKVYTDAPATRSPILTVVLAIVILAILTAAALAVLNWFQRRSAGSHFESPSAHEIITSNDESPGMNVSNVAAGSLDIWKADYEQVLQ